MASISKVSSNYLLIVSIRVVLLTAPLLSTCPPKATKASTKKSLKYFTILIFFSKICSIVIISFFFYLRGVIEKNVHIQNSNLFMSDFFVYLIFTIIFEVLNSCWIVKESYILKWKSCRKNWYHLLFVVRFFYKDFEVQVVNF